jgi:hypothetical protein
MNDLDEDYDEEVGGSGFKEVEVREQQHRSNNEKSTSIKPMSRHCK